MKKVTVAALVTALAFGVGCGNINRSDDTGGEEPENRYPCYTVDGDFVKWDDDCDDDKDAKGRKLVVGKPNGLQTAKQAAPSNVPTKTPTKAAPRPRRS